MVSRQMPAEAVTPDGVLTSLAEFDDRNRRVVELRFFGGWKITGTAEVPAVPDVCGTELDARQSLAAAADAKVG